MFLSWWSLRGRVGLSWRSQLSLSRPTGPCPLLCPSLAFVPGRLLARAAYHAGPLASLPSFVLAFLCRILPSLSKPSLSYSLEVISEHRASLQSVLLPFGPYPCWSPLPASFCLWQPLGSTGQGSRDESPRSLGFQALSSGRALDISRVRTVQPVGLQAASKTEPPGQGSQ